MPSEARPNLRKERTGIVLSNKMQKTIVVRVRQKVRHPNYGKVMEEATRYKVHDEKNEAHPGDCVRIQETRPLSKDKRWRLVEILERGRGQVSDEIKDVLASEAPKPAAKPAPKPAAVTQPVAAH